MKQSTFTNQSSETLTPFLKWAGGKRWLTSNHSTLFPSEFGHYFEPFLGGGAAFFALKPHAATLSDINQDLIDCYKAIKSDWKSVYDHLLNHHARHSTDYYYSTRKLKPIDSIEKAARFIYLNRTCWNALYRVNMKGEFNVPIGTKKNVVLDSDNFQAIAETLKNIQLVRLDFEEVINKAKEGDFIFADPPYTVKHNFNGFVKYNEKMFHWDDQIRLSETLIRANKRGCRILLTNAFHQSIIELYENDFQLTPYKRASVIAASSSKRGEYEELIIKNY